HWRNVSDVLRSVTYQRPRATRVVEQRRIRSALRAFRIRHRQPALICRAHGHDVWRPLRINGGQWLFLPCAIADMQQHTLTTAVATDHPSLRRGEHVDPAEVHAG